jgi:hypothetical protein
VSGVQDANEQDVAALRKMAREVDEELRLFVHPEARHIVRRVVLDALIQAENQGHHRCWMQLWPLVEGEQQLHHTMVLAAVQAICAAPTKGGAA